MSDTKYEVINTKTGVVVDTLPEFDSKIPKFIERNFIPGTNYLKFYPEILAQCELPITTEHFLLRTILPNLHRKTNQLRNKNAIPLRGNLCEVAMQLGVARTTCSRYFKELLEVDIIRKHKGGYFLNPVIGYYFGRNKIDPIIEELFDELITKRLRGGYSQ